MPYTMKFEDVLLPKWIAWDNGVSSIPARDFVNYLGDTWSVILSNEGISFYNVPIELINTEDEYEEGEVFEDMCKDPNTFSELTIKINPQLLEEVKQVYENYRKYEESWMNPKDYEDVLVKKLVRLSDSAKTVFTKGFGFDTYISNLIASRLMSGEEISALGLSKGTSEMIARIYLEKGDNLFADDFRSLYYLHTVKDENFLLERFTEADTLIVDLDWVNNNCSESLKDFILTNLVDFKGRLILNAKDGVDSSIVEQREKAGQTLGIDFNQSEGNNSYETAKVVCKDNFMEFEVEIN